MKKKPHVAVTYAIETMELPITVDEWLGLLKADMSTVFPSEKLLPGSGTDGFSLKSTDHKDFFSLFEHITFCGDVSDVKYREPHPDVYIISIVTSDFNPATKPLVLKSLCDLDLGIFGFPSLPNSI
uniref:pseudouridine-5'-phosphatase-like n=1 Tax=Styela clava TaxID=7725 RepID=UPI001939A10A|nr:pseudouridine-5'-phosphatase-like [Styela clava]